MTKSKAWTETRELTSLSVALLLLQGGCKTWPAGPAPPTTVVGMAPVHCQRGRRPHCRRQWLWRSQWPDGDRKSVALAIAQPDAAPLADNRSAGAVCFGGDDEGWAAPQKGREMWKRL